MKAVSPRYEKLFLIITAVLTCAALTAYAVGTGGTVIKTTNGGDLGIILDPVVAGHLKTYPLRRGNRLPLNLQNSTEKLILPSSF